MLRGGAQASAALEKDANLSREEHLLPALQLTLAAADVSHCSRPFAVSKQWFNRLAAELHQQGDVEKEAGLPCSVFADRSRPRLSACLSAYISQVAQPALALAGRWVPLFRDMFDSGLHENQRVWSVMDEEVAADGARAKAGVGVFL